LKKPHSLKSQSLQTKKLLKKINYVKTKRVLKV
jgi:hypothetical protein